MPKSKCTKHLSVGPLLEVEMSKKCTPLWREAHLEVKMLKNTRSSDHFWKFRSRKSARLCGAKHISKSKCTKHIKTHHVRTLLEVEMSKKCTPLWREAHFEVKMLKTRGVGPLLEVQISKKCTPLWREAHFEVKMYKAHHLGPLLEVEMSKKCTPLWREAHFEVKMLKTLGVRITFGGSDVASLRFTTLSHYTTLRYTPLHYITLHDTPQHYNYNYTPQIDR